MESESAGDSGTSDDVPMLFISDASAEAERLTLALRARGYVVTDVPLALLPGRVAVQMPSLVLCDADAEGALETLRKLRDAAKEPRLSVVLVGDRDGTIGRIDVGLVEAVFARPVNVQELVGTVERLVGSPGEAPAVSARGGKLAHSSRPPARAASGPLSQRPPDRSVRPEASNPSASAVPLPPDLAGDGPTPREAASDAPVVELSGDIQLLLLSAERRLGDDRNEPVSSGEEPGPEVDVEAPLPPDVLMALEEPLDEDDEQEKTGVPERSLDATGLGTRVGARAYTMSGGGTAATGLGTSATGIGTDAGPPASESAYGAPGPGTSVYPESEKRPDDEPSSDDGSRRARQQASTPRPPRPDEVRNEDRASVPPATSIEPSLQDPPPGSRAYLESEMASMRNPARELTVAESRYVVERPSELGLSRPPPVTEHYTSERDLTSTTPPVRGRDDRGTDRPPAAEAARERGTELHGEGARPTDRPSSPDAARPPSERPPSSLEGAGRRASEHPASSSGDRETRAPVERRRKSDGPEALPRREEAFAVPTVLRLGDAVFTLARAIRTRFTGSLAFEVDEGIRRVVFREGDFVTAVSGVHGESLVAFLSNRGDLPVDVARQAHKLPAFGRRAGAALIAHGHLAQDQLWPVLRSHSEWIIGRIAGIERGGATIEDLGRLHDEPAVFGGATGAEVLVEVVRRVVPPEDALERLGGADAALGPGPATLLLSECALSTLETERVRDAHDATVHHLLEGSQEPSLASALYALVALGVLAPLGMKPRPVAPKPRDIPRDDLDEEAFRARILLRKALVDEGDYFALLGVSRDATGYDIRRAYTALRREFEPSRVLTAKTSDLGDVVDEIVEVLEEAYEILGDQRRRERYRRAVEAVP